MLLLFFHTNCLSVLLSLHTHLLSLFETSELKETFALSSSCQQQNGMYHLLSFQTQHSHIGVKPVTQPIVLIFAMYPAMLGLLSMTFQQIQHVESAVDPASERQHSNWAARFVYNVYLQYEAFCFIPFPFLTKRDNIHLLVMKV